MTEHSEILIVGAGLAGLSASWHIGHERCRLLERNAHPHGHVATRQENGYTWDRGPHVSFTKHDYVRDLFARITDGAFEEFEARVGNYFQGHWIDHPAQSNLYQVPQPLRDECVADFLATRKETGEDMPPIDYAEWLERAFGPIFASTFPARYTRKYWTIEPKDLSTAWVGERVFYPSVDDVLNGAKGPLSHATHYVKLIRYPSQGGYGAYAAGLSEGARIETNKTVTSVDLAGKVVECSDGSQYSCDRLISTMPLREFIRICTGLGDDTRTAAEELVSSQLLLVDVELPCPVNRPEHWMYVYDEGKFSTRIHFPDKLSAGNVPDGCGSIQVEVYFSKFRPFPGDARAVGHKVLEELVEMGLLDSRHGPVDDLTWHIRWEEHANVIFHKGREAALERVLTSLTHYGLERSCDDLAPSTDWAAELDVGLGSLILAGRFGQHKYFWSDDCVMRGRQIAQAL